MECGETAPVCIFFAWLLNEIAGASTSEWLKAFAVLGSLAFGIYKWWYAAERNMHKRLKEYLDKEDARLISAQNDVIEALERPRASGGAAVAPLFAIAPLRDVLKQRRWHAIGSDEHVEKQVIRKLKGAVGRLDQQIEIARRRVESYQLQLAAVHTLKGAISSAIAREAWTANYRLPHDIDALDQFRSALQVPGFTDSLALKRFEAHQLRKLGHANEALLAYQSIERLAANVKSQRERDTITADAKRWQAAIMQAQRLAHFRENNIGPKGHPVAKQLLAQANPNNELVLRV